MSVELLLYFNGIPENGKLGVQFEIHIFVFLANHIAINIGETNIWGFSENCRG